MIQQVKTKIWKDESGKDVPVQYIGATARLKERNAATLLKKAKSLNKELTKFKELATKLSDDVLQKAMDEFKAKADGKGNYTWFNFDKSVKIEVHIAERIVFDDLAIRASKEKLDSFLTNNLDSKAEFVKDLVIDAFSTSRGKIDTKKILSLMRYSSKIKDPLFQEAIQILTQGITKPGSKAYFRMWERQADGEYKVIDLNFSSI